MKQPMKRTPADLEAATQPFFYEIRVRGRLSQEQWTTWFDNLTVSTRRGESVLHGQLPDHAALYGLLARLRDLAVPLLAVNVLDAEAQRKLNRASRRYEIWNTVLLATIYLALAGGMSALTVLLSGGGGLHVALALTMLFAVLGALSFGFSFWGGQKAWRWLAYGLGFGAALTFLIYTAVARIIPTPIVIATILILMAAGMAYLYNFLQGRAERVKATLGEWEKLGSRLKDAPPEEASPPESQR